MLFRRICTIAFVLFVIALFISNNVAFAGTTGGLSGRVVDSVTSMPIAGAKITVTSPSQSATTTTDGGGRFSFVSLAPDTYTLSIEQAGYDALAVPGLSVHADAQQTFPFSIRKALRTIGHVSARANGDLVRPGQTADVYSVNAAQQDRTAALGGGGNLNSAYSAIASVPGAYVPPNQSGYNQTVHVRGGDSGEAGYEFDGIPINRSFDNYPSGSTSSLGQQELQVYTGASPANSEAQGLAGSINQVIKTGTYPGTAQASFALGGPAYYHSANVEFGGANQARTFSYYVGIGGFNQDHRYVDQFDGASTANELGPVLFPCPGGAAPTLPSCSTGGRPNVGAQGSPGYVLGSTIYGGANAASIINDATRTTVVNLHFGIPHKNGLKDDVQLLYDNDQIYSALSSSALDEGLNNVRALNQYEGTGSGPALTYPDSWQYDGALGTFLPTNYSSLVVPYLFPSSPRNRAFDGNIPLDDRDVQLNQQGIFKVQYQRNFSSQAYLRLYGYTYYSDYLAVGPNSSANPYTGYDSGDYELSAHTRGLSATFADQINSRNLIELQGSLTTSIALRMNNTQPFESGDAFAVLVDRNDPASGACYQLNSTLVATATTCVPPGANVTVDEANSATFASLSGVGCATRNIGCSTALGVGPANLNRITCGTGRCGYYVVENGQYGEYNEVKPIFSGYSLTDQYKPFDKLTLDLGVRLDHYAFIGADTTGPARAFWFNAYNKDTCFDTSLNQIIDKTAIASGDPTMVSCTGKYQAINLQNISGQRTDYDILQPRLGMTYAVDADTVVRASYGKYNEQPSSAYEQYSALQQNLPDFIGTTFYQYGFSTPTHDVRPSVSYNADLSLEHAFKGTDLSLKLTPFLRKTHDEVENFVVSKQSGLTSGFNIGQQTSEGFELALNKGDFGRNGFAAALSFAYTNSYVQFSALPNGGSIVSPINADIEQYNAYTSYCATHAADVKCGGVAKSGAANVTPTNGVAASPCYLATGKPSACGVAGAVANPYWNAPPQPLLDPNGKYLPYSYFPGPIASGAAVNSFEYPYVATLILNYKRNRFAITPSFQLEAGNRYGAPETTPGIDPAAGCAALGGATTAHDPRYPYGTAGGAPYDASSCSPSLLSAIPDPYTGQFDGIGAFREPAELLANLRLSYQATKNVELVGTFANIINRCFGGQKTAFTYYDSPQVCSYGVLQSYTSPVGNAYNPKDNVQTYLRYPYEPSFGSYNSGGSSLIQPFSAYLSLRVKL